jgi:serine/threonine protein kinase
LQDQSPYLVFEYVAGLTLAQQLVADGPMPTAAAVALMQDILSALVAAHAMRRGSPRPQTVQRADGRRRDGPR